MAKMDDHAACLSNLRETVARLEERLTSVMLPAMPVLEPNKETVQQEQEQSSMANRLDEFNQSAREAMIHINGITAALEI